VRGGALASIALMAAAACNPGKGSGAAIVAEGGGAPPRPSPEVRPQAGRQPEGPMTASSAPMLRSSGVRIVPALADTDALTLIRTKRLEAKADGRVLVVYVGATWCEPCKRFKRELESGKLDARLAKVALLAFDADTDADRLGAAGYAFKFVPFVALPGADGRPMESTQAKGKGAEAWRELLDSLDAWQAAR
jgi:thiol-disulfide isomerase/thioredoxin